MLRKAGFAESFTVFNCVMTRFNSNYCDNIPTDFQYDV